MHKPKSLPSYLVTEDSGFLLGVHELAAAVPRGNRLERNRRLLLHGVGVLGTNLRANALQELTLLR